nr:hypothetical protein Iba_chr13dCG4200 [Ipomoea batatas]
MPGSRPQAWHGVRSTSKVSLRYQSACQLGENQVLQECPTRKEVVRRVTRVEVEVNHSPRMPNRHEENDVSKGEKKRKSRCCSGLPPPKRIGPTHGPLDPQAWMESPFPRGRKHYPHSGEWCRYRAAFRQADLVCAPRRPQDPSRQPQGRWRG